MRSAPHPPTRWLLTALLGLGTVTALILAMSAGSQAAGATAFVFPVPNGHFASPRTQITFRGVPASALGTVTVTGSRSGAHAGRIVADSDGNGASFIPNTLFRANETVTVTAGVAISGGSGNSFSFTIGDPAPAVPGAYPKPAPRTNGDVARFASRHDLLPARVQVTKRPVHAAPGDIFLAPQNGPYQEGPMIVGPYGGLIFFLPAPKGDAVTDFRTQTYLGKPVLTWWQGAVSHAGTGSGHDVIYDSNYHQLAFFDAGNGLHADLHEFEITPRNTALITGYYSVYVTTGSGTAARKRLVLDAVAQEIDIPTGNVLYQWDSLDHVPLTASYQPAPGNPNHPWDYFHINALQPLSDGSILISSRNAWAAFDTSGQTGAINWTLGGKLSTFKMGSGAQFAFQHDLRLRPGNLVTVFDDGAGPPAVHKQSRGLTLKLDFSKKTADVVGSDEHGGPSLLAFYEGNVQPLANGDDFVGWGQQPYATEFDKRGHEVFDLRFVGQNSSYRAYRFSWTGTPTRPPAIASAVHRGHTTVYASWNGATGVHSWRVLAGPRANALTPVATHGRTDFEVTVPLQGREAYVAAQALDIHGHVMGTSRTIKGY
ncbi:MAG TPA: arylsulfotransferase family protein [Solirubrobacteraceae bacterium]|nr:arylsulfotransferase family protein [Solirubrobacteraceae bacterium]